MVDDLERLPEPGSLVSGEGNCVVRSRVGEHGLALPQGATNVDDFAAPTDRIRVGDAVETFDHLGSRCTEAKMESPVGNVVQACAAVIPRRVGVRE